MQPVLIHKPVERRMPQDRNNKPFLASLHYVRWLSSTHLTLPGIPLHFRRRSQPTSFCILLRTRTRSINQPHYTKLLQASFFRQATCSVCTSAKTHLRFSQQCCCTCSSTVPLRTSSTVLTGIRAGRSEVRTPEGKTFILQNVYTGCGAHPASCPLDTRDFFPAVKRPGLGVNRSLPCSAEVKNERSYNTTPPIHLHSVARDYLVTTHVLYKARSRAN